ncbi:MAG: hypothetical protein ACPGJV_10145 [Bacteriovoracaceae bacterium]
MKVLFAIAVMFSMATVSNMYTFGYGINDAFWRVVWAIDEGTIWAESFNEENFSKIKLGMEDEVVLKLIGRPLELVKDYDAVEETWIYTKQDSGTSDYDQRVIIFRKNKVFKIIKSFYID